MKKWSLVTITVLVIGAGAAGYMYYKSSTTTPVDSQEATSASTSTPSAGTKSVSVIIVDAKSLSRLGAALKSTLLSDTLEGTGPYTVLAPTDDAFKNMPAGVLDMLLKVDSKEKLKNILNYHVIPGTLALSQFTNGQKIKTVNGQELVVEVTDKQVTFVDAKGGKAMVVEGDKSATNGMVHTISAVLLPQ